MRWIRLVLFTLVSIFLLGLGSWFALRNQTPVPLDLILIQFEAGSLATWMMIAFMGGALCSLFVMIFTLLRMQARLAGARSRVQKLQKEVNQLKNQQGAKELAPATS
ncbi:Protein of unknown function [Allopseudospirillum japonicum]|uniref:Lipopolysaccharide assembly protein A domain-containing protein n=1 Tax=Allopseudospirillum japonicum TaxID=64971 RepID=A0A1H6TE69_9GAMM|nr:LapA family protein [Allopseudospirillum japonicum]SEI74082.1 Protein of unknown function [Allopseudospirillum japonicum]